MKKKEKIFNFFDVFIIVTLTSFIMFGLGSILIYKHLGGINYSLVSDDENLKDFINSYNNLIDNYYEDLDKKQIINGAISGMYNNVGDPYTSYLEDKSSNILNNSLNGKYKGIGISVSTNKNNEIYIKIVHDNSPALKNGLKPGDIIKKVNEKDIINLNTEEVSTLIKNSKNDRVRLTISRNNKLHDFVIDVKTILVPAVRYQIINKNNKSIGYLRIMLFNDTADIQVEKALKNLEKNNIDSLIIDLRDNSGGYLQVCENIVELFLEKGKTIYYLENKEGKKTIKDKTLEKRKYPISILINKNSASAAEILASSLKYSYGTKIYGTKSFGKGKVQEKNTLKDGTVIKYTTARWLMPNGKCLDGIGLNPDEKIEFKKENYVETDIKTDNQINYIVDKLVE